jgi:histidyl-tRNA synthetase
LHYSDGHPLKEGELISLDNLAEEVQQRLKRKKELDGLAKQAEGLKVVHGIKGDDVSAVETAPEITTSGTDTGDSAEPAAAPAEISNS